MEHPSPSVDWNRLFNGLSNGVDGVTSRLDTHGKILQAILEELRNSPGKAQRTTVDDSVTEKPNQQTEDGDVDQESDIREEKLELLRLVGSWTGNGLWRVLYDELQNLRKRSEPAGCSSRLVCAIENVTASMQGTYRILEEIDVLSQKRTVARGDSRWSQLAHRLHALLDPLEQFNQQCDTREVWFAMSNFWTAVKHCDWSLQDIRRLKMRLERVIDTVQAFTEQGIPAMRSFQQDRATQHINLSQSAAFLASVAATTLQYSQLTPDDGGATAATVALWYGALVLAITSALLSLLASVLASYPHRDHDNRLHFMMRPFIKIGPMLSLGLAGVLLLLGIAVFATLVFSPLSLRIVMATITSVFIALLLCIAVYCLASKTKVLRNWGPVDWDDAFAQAHHVVPAWQTWLVKLHPPKFIVETFIPIFKPSTSSETSSEVSELTQRRSLSHSELQDDSAARPDSAQSSNSAQNSKLPDEEIGGSPDPTDDPDTAQVVTVIPEERIPMQIVQLPKFKGKSRTHPTDNAPNNGPTSTNSSPVHSNVSCINEPGAPPSQTGPSFVTSADMDLSGQSAANVGLQRSRQRSTDLAHGDEDISAKRSPTESSTAARSDPHRRRSSSIASEDENSQSTTPSPSSASPDASTTTHSQSNSSSDSQRHSGRSEASRSDDPDGDTFADAGRLEEGPDLVVRQD